MRPALYVSTLRSRAPSVSSALLLLGLLLFAVVLGLATVVFPPGLIIRVVVPMTGLSVLLFAWVLRRREVPMPGRSVLYLLLLTAALSILWPRYIYFSVGGPSVNPQTLSVFAALAVTTFCLIHSPAMSQAFSRVAFSTGKIGVLILLWFAWRLFACIVGEYPVPSLIEYLRELVYLGSFFMFGCAIASYEDGPRLLLRVIVLCGLAVALAGVVEAFMQRNAFTPFASGTEAAAESLQGVVLDKFRGGQYRAQSVFTHPIVFAQFVAAMVPLAGYFVLYERSFFWRFVGLLLLPLCALAILKSGSRSGLVSLATAIAFTGFVIWLRALSSKGVGKAIAVAAMPVFLFGIAVAYFVVEELIAGRTQAEAGSTQTRAHMVSMGISALFESPLTGFGQGLAIVKAGVANSAGITTIDSYFLTVALDSGYVGLALWLALLTMFCIGGARAALILPGSRGAQVGLLTAAALAVVATFAGLSIPHNLSLFWLLVSAALPAINAAAASPDGKS